MFRHHIEILHKNILRVELTKRLVGSELVADAKTFRITALSLVYSTFACCAPAWCRSAHTRIIGSLLNDAMRIVTGCLRHTPKDYLPILAGI